MDKNRKITKNFHNFTNKGFFSGLFKSPFIYQNDSEKIYKKMILESSKNGVWDQVGSDIEESIKKFKQTELNNESKQLSFNI